MLYIYFATKIGSGVNIQEALVQALKKTVIKTFKRRKVCLGFKDDI